MIWMMSATIQNPPYIPVIDAESGVGFAVGDLSSHLDWEMWLMTMIMMMMMVMVNLASPGTGTVCRLV